MTFVNFAAGRTGPYYVVAAKCDLDGNAATETQLIGSSYENIIHSANEGY